QLTEFQHRNAVQCGSGLAREGDLSNTDLPKPASGSCSQIFLPQPFDEFFQSNSGGCARIYQLPFSQMNINVRIPRRKNREASR
ncbi:hypothetical protein NUV89_24630, partial [Pseudomonas sp. 18.1.10]|uniref:hypothetical protein n=1 Tax=Pseudomonas sp. 18.1.10 TaxID=2969302 RepID=UPI00215057FD